MAEQPHYRAPGRITRSMLNPVVLAATRAGISIWGSRMLEVRGRTSGEVRRTPVNVLELDGQPYLVSARGNGQWVRNVRAAGGQLTLVVGRRRQAFVAEEITGQAKADILRAYLRRWKMEVGAFFDGVDASASDAELLRIAPDHPVFRLVAAPAGAVA